MRRAVVCAALLGLAACASWDARLKLPLRADDSDLAFGKLGFVTEPFEPGTDATELAALAMLEAMDQGATTIHAIEIRVRVGDLACSVGAGGRRGSLRTPPALPLSELRERTIERRIDSDCQTTSRFVDSGRTTRPVVSLIATRVRQPRDLGKPRQRACDATTIRKRIAVPRFLEQIDVVPIDWSLLVFARGGELAPIAASCERVAPDDHPPYMLIVTFESAR